MVIVDDKGVKYNLPKIVTLTIGQLFACSSEENIIIKTVLGSCVSCCLLDPISKVAGMNHILLPSKPDNGIFDDAGRYGITAMEKLINEMTKLGAKRFNLQAKVFGGGHVITSIPKEKGPGSKNVEIVLKYLELENIPILAKDVGGEFTRVIQFHTPTFDVYVKKIPASSMLDVINSETNAEKEVQKKVLEDTNITLFND